MCKIYLLSILIFSFLTASFPARSQTYEILHEFNMGLEQGASPYSQSLVMNDGRFFGLLHDGGAYDCGVLFSMLPDGSDYTVHFNFHPTRNVGAFPLNTPIISGGRVYGICNDGGDNRAGTVFSMNLDGSDAQVLHHFDPDAGDGEYPTGDLLLIAGVLYGVTEEGGANDVGTIFSINLDGSNYAVLFEFGYGNDGAYPVGGLVEFDGALFGVCFLGGLNNGGTLFTIEPDGSNFGKLLNFGAVPGRGRNPEGKLLEYDGVLYGTTYHGGSNDKGVIFSYDIADDDYDTLHDFAGGTTDGENPVGPLYFYDNRIYGMTPYGGTADDGVVFGIDPDGGSYFAMRSLGASTSDPAYPYGGFVEFGGILYAMSSEGGSEDDTGCIFSYDHSLDDLIVLYDFPLSNEGLYSPTNSLTAYDGKLYGSAWFFSIFSESPPNMIYSIDPDGSDYEVRDGFDIDEGFIPQGDLYVYDGELYGTCQSGPSYFSGNGTFYKFDPQTDIVSGLFEFPDDEIDYSYPITTPTPIDGLFYGVTYYDGPRESGYFYSIAPDGSGFDKIKDFGGQEGEDAGAGDVVYYDGKVFGTTLYGGDDGSGTIFSYDIDSDTYSTLYEFDGATDGDAPADLIEVDGVFYGCALYGGDNEDGSIFKFDPSDNSFETIFSFDRTAHNGWGIYQRLVHFDGRFYGIAYDSFGDGEGGGPDEKDLRNGGDYDEGVFFSIKTDGTDYIEHHAFLDGNYADGYAPYCAPTRIGASFFGTTYYGGASDLGTVFKYTFEPPTVTASITDNNSDGDEPEITAEITAEITSTGGVSAKRRGVCWDYAANPDPDVNDNVSDENGTFSLGQFINNLNLSPGQVINIRAFAENSFGVGYSEVMTVYPLSEEPEGLPNLFITDEGDMGGIYLHFSAPQDLNNCKGHLIVINACVEPTGLPENRNLYEIGDALPGGSGTVAAVITSYNQVNFELFDEIIPDDYYRIVIYPFNWNGVDEETINYKTENVRKAIGNTDLNVFYTLDGLTVPERIIRRFVADFFLIVSEYDPVLVEYDGNLRLQAVESITFKPGFKVEAGAALLAEIAGQRPCTEGQQVRKIAIPGLEPERFDAFVYPNPTRGDLTIVADAPGEEPIEVKVIDALGVVRISELFAGGALNLELDNLPSGAYFVTISSGSELETFKIAVIK